MIALYARVTDLGRDAIGEWIWKIGIVTLGFLFDAVFRSF